MRLNRRDRVRSDMLVGGCSNSKIAPYLVRLQCVKGNHMRTRLTWLALVVVCGMATARADGQPAQVPGAYGAAGGATGPGELPPGGTSPATGSFCAAAVMVGEPLPNDAQDLISGFERDSVAIREKAEQEIQLKRRALINALQTLQDSYTRDARLDEAVAIRDVLRQLRTAQLKALPDPGNLIEYASRIGESFYFEVVGNATNSIWGTEVYTYDSNLATAAVHSGVLKVGQKGIVKVTLLKNPNAHQGSTQNGVTSSGWGSYSASYTVERPKPDDVPPLLTKPVGTAR